MESTLKIDDIEDYLRYLYFGEVNDIIKTSIDKAYLDFNRTLRGISRFSRREECINNAKSTLYETITDMLKSNHYSQDIFDNWHKDCCDNLIENFDGFKVYYGQAQKWINMTFKYMFILNKEMVSSIYQYLHIPIDNIILQALRPYDDPKFNYPWSKIDNYQEYLYFQNWFRNKFNGIPMDNEFKLWLGKSINLR